MLLPLSIFLMSLWVVYKDKHTFSSILRVIFYLSLVYLIISVWKSSDTIANFFLFLFICFITLAFVGFILDLSRNSKISQITIILVSVVAGYFMDVLMNSQNGLAVDQLSPDQIDEFLIEIDKHHMDDLKKFTTDHQATLTRAFSPQSEEITELDNYYLLNVKESENCNSLLSTLKKIKGINWVEINEIIPFEFPETTKEYQATGNALSNDPSVVMQWHLSFLQMDKYYQFFKEKQINPTKTAKLYILDTGLDSGHEDLSMTGNIQKDKQGHGTHCAGVAAAVTNNKIGVASMSPAPNWIDIHGIQVIGDVGFGTQKAIIDGIIRAADEGADVISMSLGGITNQEREKAYNDAVRYANNKGAIVVVAAGNANLDGKRYSPANAENVITVTSVNEKSEKSGFSNHVQNIKLGIAAPGERILSTTPSNTYTAYNGTSMATPQVAGLIAVMKAIDPGLTTESIYTLLNKTGKDTQNSARTGKLIQPFELIKMMNSKYRNEL